MQKKYKAEISELHDALLQVKRDYDLLRMEFEQNLKANEQTGLSLFYLTMEIYLAFLTEYHKIRK